MANPKVFEFAKEIGMETLVLMAKIREWQLPIKSHMAELTPDLMEQVKVRLNPPKDASAAKKSAVKKKLTAVVAPSKKTTTSAQSVQTGSVATGATSKVVRRKAVVITEADLKKSEIHEVEVEYIEENIEDIESEDPAKAEVAAKTNVAVKTNVAEVIENIASEKLDNPLAKSAQGSIVDEKPSIETPSKGLTPAATILPKSSDVILPEAVTPPHSAASIVSTSVVVTAASSVEIAVVSVPDVKSTVVDLAKQIEEKIIIEKPGTLKEPVVEVENIQAKEVKKVNRPFDDKKPHWPQAHLARKKEVVVGQSGFASSQKPANEVVRKNIVGRMDLSRVTPPPRPSNTGSDGRGFPGSSRPAAPNTSGNAAARGPVRNNLRTGFVASPAQTPPPFEEPENTHHKSKFDDRNKKFSKGQTAEPSGSGVEAAQVAFNPSDYRKREMVFQPKKKKGILNRLGLKTQLTTPKATKRILKVNGTMRLGDAAETMGIKAAQIIKSLMTSGVMANMNTTLDFDTLALVSPDFGWEAQNVFRTANEILDDTAFGDIDAEVIHRPPVVTVMGHVDHGKTSLLDAIRQTDVAAGEAGGITQHIGAYQVKLDTGELVTFLDTPGHEAFTAMRARGANVTDIAVIVVAADDGLMPQTAEAINHAKAAGVPIVIAINKIDKPGANTERIKQQLTEFEIVPEEWGGSNIFCEVSALKRTGIKELLVQLLLVAEMQELKANPKRSGTGIVIEGCLDKGRGSVATLLVKDGTIRVGDLIVAGTASGRVRSMMSYKGEKIEEATPGMPVELLGLTEVPMAGDKFDVVKDEKTLERVLDVRRIDKAKAQSSSTKMSLEDLFAKAKEGEQKTLNIILKSDVMGSSEAIQGMFQKLNTQEVKLKVIHSAVGGISEGDVLLATTAKAIVVGFNTRPDSNAQNLAKRSGVELRTYSIVYEMIDDLKKLMSGLLEPDIVEQVHGRVEVRNTFTVPKIGTIAGCAVTEGKIMRSHLVRLIRSGVVVYQGKISSLKRFKDDVKEVASGYECGIGIENFNDIKVGDVIEAYTREEVRKNLTELQPSV